MLDIVPRTYTYMPIRVGTLDLVTISPSRYRLAETLPTGMVLQTIDEDEPRFVPYTDEEFYRLHVAGKARVEEGYFSEVKARLRNEIGKPFNKFKPHQQAKAHYFRALIEHYERVAEKEGGIARTKDELGPRMVEFCLAVQGFTNLEALKKHKGFKPISFGHFNRMYRAFIMSDENMLSLVSKDAGPKGRKLHVCAESLAIWQKHADRYAQDRRHKQRQLYIDMQSDIGTENRRREAEGEPIILSECSFKVFRNLIFRLGAYHVFRGRYGFKRAQRKFALSHGGFSLFKPGERVDIDEKLVDLMVLLEYAHIWETLSDEEKNLVHRIRLWVVVAIDVATRYILAMRFCYAPNEDTTIDVIRMMMSDKTELSSYLGAIAPWIGRARPELVYTDNGSALVSQKVLDTMHQCEVDHTRPPAEHPAARGHLESFFRGNDRVVRFYSGRTFKDVLEKMDYNPVSEASLPLDEFERAYIRAIVDVYHNSPHEGLGGETPHNAWVRMTLQYKMRPLIEPDVMRHIFGMELTRTLGGHGVTFFGIDYTSPVLARLFLDKGAVEVAIKVDVMDLTSISFEMDGGQYIADNAIALAPGIGLAEWVYMWKLIARTFKGTGAVTMPIVHETLNHMRLSGDSAALRNPIGMRNVSREEVLKEERKMMHKARLSPRPGDEPMPTLASPQPKAGAFLDEFAPGFENLVEEVKEELAAEAGKPKKTTTSRSQIGSAGDIGF